MSDFSIDNQIQEFVENMSNEDKWKEDEVEEVERDENGTYIYLLPHLLDMIPVGVPRPNQNNRVALFHESVIETIVEEWENCKQMCCDLIPDFRYAGLFLDTTDKSVGGFSYKDRKDEAKGTIIECINSGRITTVVTPGLQQKHILVFLPNASTLSAMDEFQLLTEAPYTICFMDNEGNVQLTDIGISYVEVANMISSEVSIRDALILGLSSSGEVDTGMASFDDDNDWDTESDLVGLDLTKEDIGL